MSVYTFDHYNEDGAKIMRPVLTREDYLALRGSSKQTSILNKVRTGRKSLKNSLVQMNYSCIPGDDGLLKGCKTPSRSVGMDIDFVAPAELSAEEQQAWLAEKMAGVPELVLSKREELGLLMLERSATKGYHLAFRRHEDLSQVDNLQWASQLLGIKFDDGAKDITRVFYTTTADENELLFLDDEIFDVTPLQCYSSDSSHSCHLDQAKRVERSLDYARDDNASYNGIPFTDIIAKYWEMFNGGKVPNVGDRNAHTFDLALTLRSICGYNLERMMQVIPNYWTAPDGTCTADEKAEYQQTLANALKEPRKGMPLRLKQVLQALKSDNGVKACGGTISTPPPLPKRLPPLVKLLTSNVPDLYKPAVASTVFPSLGAHLHGVKFRY